MVVEMMMEVGVGGGSDGEGVSGREGREKERIHNDTTTR